MRLRELDIFTRLLRTRPLFTAALLFLCGCISAYFLDLRLWVWIAAAAVLLIILPLCRKRPQLLCALLVLLMLPLGALRFGLAWSASEPVPEADDVHISGRICEIPFYNSDTERCICVLDAPRINAETLDGKIRLYLRGDTDALQRISLGDEVNCSAHLWQGDPASNPAQFDFGLYLRINGLRGYATAKLEDTYILPGEYHLSDLNDRFCATLSERIDRLFPRNAAIIKAFVLGIRSEIDTEDRESYNNSGAAHLLAISGMHISALAMLISWLFGRFLKRSRAFALTMLLLLAYAWLIGFTAPLLRALIVFGLHGLGGVCRRHPDGPTNLAAAALIHLLISPLDILSASFILSYGASTGIALFTRPLERLLHAEELLHGRMERRLHGILTRMLPRALVRSLITTLSVQLATLPAVIHFFGAQPLWTLIVNLVAVPLSMLGYICSIVALIPGIAPICAIADGIFGLLNIFVRVFGAIPVTTLQLARFPHWMSLIWAALMLAASDLAILPEKLRRALPFSVIPLALCACLIPAAGLNGQSFVFMDAGQADCALLRTEGKLYFFDVGDDYSPAADYLSAMNYDVDGVFLSHPHSDHVNGLADILTVCTPETIYISPNYDQLDLDEGVAELLTQAAAQGSYVQTLQAGDCVSLSEKSFVKVLAPTAGISARPANEDSMMLHVICGDYSALFCGDMPAECMPADLPDVDILKIAHHGAADSVDPRILTQTSPTIAVVPVGYNNYGHPAEAALELIDAAGAEIYRTDLCGAITVSLDEDGMRVSTYNGFGGV